MAYSKITLNGQTLMDVTNDTVEANKLLTGETATAANGQKVTGTLVTSNDFVITLTQNQTTGNWEPDCTYAEAVAAYNAGKKVAFVKTDGVPCAGEYNDFDAIIYYVDIDNYNGSDGSGKKATSYIWNSTGITKDLVSIYYDTSWSNAIPSEVLFGKNFHNASGAQVGTATARSSSALTVSGATVTAPAGYYANAATKSVASGTAGTPTATKGTVSNHSVSVTPSVTNTTGYITGGTKTGTAVSVSASELVSGTKSITENGNAIDVTNYASVDVNVESVNNQNKTVTPTKSQQSITADTGYTGLGTVTMDPIPANYVQVKDTYLSNNLDITPSESNQIIDVLDQVISSNPQYSTLTISNKVGTCNVSFSGLENNVPYLMSFQVAGEHNNQYFHNYKIVIVMFTNEVTSINLSNFETDGYLGCVNSAVVTKSGNITVNFNIDIVGSVYATLQYRKNNNNIIGYKYGYVHAIPSTYVGSGVARKSSSDLTVSGAKITAPAGYYANAATKSVASGTAGTPTATKGTVSNHSVSVTPSVTNTTGYITGGTKNGTAVTVNASELVSGTKSITENGTGIDVTNYASVDVAVSGGSSVEVNPLSVTSNGTYTAPTGTAYNPVTVNVSGSGGSVEPKDVNFIDYDGTILYSYTTAEALALTSLPANPTHNGLTSQGWNYSLAQIKAECNDSGKCTIGQMYITDSGDTEIDVKFVDPLLLSPYLSISLTGTASIDWGDNSPTDAISSSGNYQHIYTAAGEYTIRIHVTSGTLALYGTEIQPILNRNANINFANVAYSNCITAVRIGNNVTKIGNYCFYFCYSMKTITIPNTVTLIGSNAFRYCSSLIHITVPYNVTSIGQYAFDRCYSIQTVSLPSGLVSIDQYLFDYCNSLRFIAIPSSVQTIGYYAFQYCYSLRMVGIPSLLTSMGYYAFRGCNSLATITIPSGVTSLTSYLLYQNYSIASLNIPNGVTSIAAYALNGMYALTELHVQPITPPTLAATSLEGIQTYCVIYVPQGSLAAYQTATNWSKYASYMVEESA